MDSVSIKVDIDELIDRLEQMRNDEFVTVELTINTENYYEDYSLRLKALDISQEEDADYGEIGAITEFN